MLARLNSKTRNPKMIVPFRALLILMSFGIFMLFVSSARGSTLTVTNTNDGGPGSLRQAILSANANPGFDVIEFNIPRRGVQTILPLFALPLITDSVLIDGWSQGPSGYEGPPLIEISGTNLLQLNGSGLRIGCFLDGCPEGVIEVDDSTVRGLVINGFQASPGFVAHGLVITGDNNTVTGCYIGTTANGEAAFPNEQGISVRGDGNLIGGTTTSARNAISGNHGSGISVKQASENNRIQGNYIGLSASGLHKVGNAFGVIIEGSNNLVGGTSDGARNVVSGNYADGVQIFNSTNQTISNNRIQGNYIGTSPDGNTAGFGNQGWGVRVEPASTVDTLVGGATAQSGNVISGNGDSSAGGGGIALNGERTRVQNNLIGVGADRTTQMGNLGAGIHITTRNNLIGGPFNVTVPTGNIIAYNQGAGISVFDSLFLVGNKISNNKIYGNLGLGIDLGQNGVTANDFCDFDTGPNNLQNFPVLTSIGLGRGRVIQISGYVPGNKVSYRIEFFNNSTCDPSGNGEGERFIGSVNTGPASPFCRVMFVATLSDLTLGELGFITATATDPDGNTSEFSGCLSAH